MEQEHTGRQTNGLIRLNHPSLNGGILSVIPLGNRWFILSVVFQNGKVFDGLDFLEERGLTLSSFSTTDIPSLVSKDEL